MTAKINKIIDQLKLEPHPEGGYFKETYRSHGEIPQESLAVEYAGKRSYATCIYFLLTADNFSAFHKIKQDEIWHFYDGSAICLHMISESGVYSKQLIGREFDKGEVPQYVVPGGYWFASEVIDAGSYSLVGCTVSPGFSFEDFELKTRKELTSLFPNQAKIIARFTHR